MENLGVGETNTAAWNDGVYLAREADGSGIISRLARLRHNGKLAPGVGYSRTADVQLPHGISGTCFVVVSTGGPYEGTHTDNNTNVSAAVQVSLAPSADLAVTDVLGPQTATSGSKVDISWTVRNLGSGW